MSQVEDPHLVKARPAYHYRLPNCLIDEPDWRLAREWNTWVAVERLAADAPAAGRDEPRLSRGRFDLLPPVRR